MSVPSFCMYISDAICSPGLFQAYLHVSWWCDFCLGMSFSGRSVTLGRRLKTQIDRGLKMEAEKNSPSVKRAEGGSCSYKSPSLTAQHPFPQQWFNRPPGMHKRRVRNQQCWEFHGCTLEEVTTWMALIACTWWSDTVAPAALLCLDQSVSCLYYLMNLYLKKKGRG